MKYLQWISKLLLIISFNSALSASDLENFDYKLNNVNGENSLKVYMTGSDNSHLFNGSKILVHNKIKLNVDFVNSVGDVPIDSVQSGLQTIKFEDFNLIKLYYIDAQRGICKQIPFWLSILPPLLAIIFALLFREVLFSLFAGIWMGSFIIAGAGIKDFLPSLFQVVELFAVEALSNSSHASIIVFSILIGGMVAIISRNGGMEGFIKILSKFAKNAKSTQLICWLSGIMIFFDDYANTLIVGNTLRPLTDKFKVSREKLAYIVDSTAAPIASVAFISTWIGYELGEIDTVIQSTAALKAEITAYQVFLNSLKYAYYPFLTLIFIYLLIAFNKDFSNMLVAENRARESGVTSFSPQSQETVDKALEPKAGLITNGLYAIIPILMLIVITFLLLVFYGGSGEVWTDPSLRLLSKLQTVIGNADPYKSLLWGSTGGIITAALMSVGGRKLNLKECSETLLHGFKSMLNPVIILILAWSLASVTTQLCTADFLISLLPSGFNPRWLPGIFFILAALISFATGSSWGTMAILFPIGLPLAYAQGAEFFNNDMQEILNIIFNISSVILAGSVFGDHCSPISDTTILSSLASQCDHIEHVRTQLPYAMTIGIISLICGGLLFALNIPWWISYIVGLILVILVVKFIGKEVTDPAQNG